MRAGDIEECTMTVMLRGGHFVDLTLDEDEALAAVNAARAVHASKRRNRRPLTRSESIAAWRMAGEGSGYATIADRLGCTPLMVRTAIGRVEGGRYGEVSR